MKYIFIFSIVIASTQAVAQTPSIHGEIHFESLIYQGDTLAFNPPKTIVISKIGKTPVTTLGRLKLVEFGVQYELLKSGIGQSEYYMLGKCFYIKDLKGWKEISRFDYAGVHFEKGPPIKIPNTFQGIYAAEEDENDFAVGSWYIFFIN